MKAYNFLKSAGLIFVLFSFHNLALCQKINWALYGVKSSSPFHDGLAIFQEGFWGAINTSGEVAIPPKFYSMTNFTNGTAVVKIETGEGIINRKGSYILQPVYGRITRNRKHQNVFEVYRAWSDSAKSPLPKVKQKRVITILEYCYIEAQNTKKISE